jgi:hypothetical protein
MLTHLIKQCRSVNKVNRNISSLTKICIDKTYSNLPTQFAESKSPNCPLLLSFKEKANNNLELANDNLVLKAELMQNMH